MVFNEDEINNKFKKLNYKSGQWPLDEQMSNELKR